MKWEKLENMDNNRQDKLATLTQFLCLKKFKPLTHSELTIGNFKFNKSRGSLKVTV